MTISRKWLLGLACSLGVFANNALAADTSTSQANTEAGALIGFVLPTQEVVRYPHEFAWFEAELAKYGDKAIVGYANSNATTMTNVAQNMFQQGIKVLVIDPVDAVAGGILTKQAQALGIKVVTYDTDVTGATPDWWVGRSGVQLGYQHVDSALAAKPCGNYAIIRGDKGYTNYHLISEAYDAKLLKTECVNVVFDADSQGWVTSAAMKNAEAAIQKSADVAAIVCMWDNCAQAAVQALKIAGKKPGEVYVTGTDSSPQSMLLIAAGWQGMSSFTPIHDMAVAAAKLAHSLTTGKDLPKPTSVQDGKSLLELKPILVNRENLCDFTKNVAPEGWGISLDQLAEAGLKCE